MWWKNGEESNVEEHEEDTGNQKKGAEEPDGAEMDANSTTGASDAKRETLDGMVRGKEKIDASGRPSQDNNSGKSQVWVETKSTRVETTLKIAVGIDRHSNVNVRRDQHGNSRRSGAESAKHSKNIPVK